jgi:hypothetical protein
MIIARLIGGLGNQLFQYAVGRRLSLMHHTSLKLDLSWFGQQEQRNYALDHFSITSTIATDAELAPFLKSNSRINRNFNRMMKIILPALPQKNITEKSVDFDPAILNAPDNVYLDGYWQSEKYFKDIAPILEKEFVVRTPPDQSNRKALDMVNREKNPVCIHIRRSDYVTNPTTNRYHGVLPIDYYHSGIELLEHTTRDPHFFIFSDDMEAVRGRLYFKSPVTYFMHNTSQKDYEDFRLMCSCRHFIIANSSFSWWAAYLSKGQDKTILAPSRWFSGIPYNPKDRIPDSWIQL